MPRFGCCPVEFKVLIGPTGATGATGATGPTGPAGTEKVIVFAEQPATIGGEGAPSPTALTNWNEVIDLENAFDPVTGVFTAPSDGVYEFSAVVAFLVDQNVIQSGNMLDAPHIDLIYPAETVSEPFPVVNIPTPVTLNRGEIPINYVAKLTNADPVYIQYTNTPAGLPTTGFSFNAPNSNTHLLIRRVF